MLEIIFASFSLFISFIALLYTFITNTKKYELTYQHRQEIMSWYSTTNQIVLKLFSSIDSDIVDNYSLGQLSNQIELGRFFFPNIIKDDFGAEKPSAYRGYRNAVIEVLVMLFGLFNRNNKANYIQHVKTLQRVFTSYVFDSLNIRQFNKEIKKATGHQFDGNNIDDYLALEPNENILYRYLTDNTKKNNPPQKS